MLTMEVANTLAFIQLSLSMNIHILLLTISYKHTYKKTPRTITIYRYYNDIPENNIKNSVILRGGNSIQG